MRNNLYIILLLNSIFINLESYVQTKVFNSHVGADMISDDSIIAKEKCNLTIGGTLKGSGYIESPLINICVGKFEFTGKIHCNNECTITAKEPFNEDIFQRSGGGRFIIKIDPNLKLNKSDEIPATSIPTQIPTDRSTSAISKKYEISGSTFTAVSQWHIDIMEAIIKSDLELVGTLLDKCPDIKNDSHELGIFMLFAGLYGKIEVVKELIKLGADINGKDVKREVGGQHHLISAIVAKKLEFVVALIKAGVDPNIRDRNWYPNSRSALTIAVLLDNTEIVKALLQSPKIDVEAKIGFDYNTALMYAAHKGNIQIVRALLDAGADSEKTNFYRVTALDIAIDAGHTEVANLIKEFKKKRESEKTPIKESETKKEDGWFSSLDNGYKFQLALVGGIVGITFLSNLLFDVMTSR
jgi:hypothetical protein